MSISRIGKLVAETSPVSSLDEAARRRSHDVDVFLPPRVTPKVSALAHAVTSLAIRCFTGRVRVHAVDRSAPGLPWLRGSLLDQLHELSVSFDGSGRIASGHAAPPAAVRLSIACAVQGAISVDASGAWAAVNMGLPGDEAAGFACAFAASCGVAKAFAASVLEDRSFVDEAWRFSLTDFTSGADGRGDPTTLPCCTLGNVGVLGAGAVGSAFLYALWLSGAEANVEVIDHDRYEEANCETTMFVGRREAARRAAKAPTLSRLAQTRLLRIHGTVARLAAGDGALARPRDAFVCAADNAGIRRELDAVSAGVLLNGATGGRRESAGHVLCTRHGPGDPPLSALYANQASAPLQVDGGRAARLHDLGDECSRLAYQEASLAAPFVSLAAGALLAARCAAHAAGDLTQPSYIKLDLLGKQSSF